MESITTARSGFAARTAHNEIVGDRLLGMAERTDCELPTRESLLDGYSQAILD
jgi:hypothetical protein